MVKFTIRGTLPGLNELIEAERSHKQMGAKLKKAVRGRRAACGKEPREVEGGRSGTHGLPLV